MAPSGAATPCSRSPSPPSATAPSGTPPPGPRSPFPPVSPPSATSPSSTAAPYPWSTVPLGCSVGSKAFEDTAADSPGFAEGQPPYPPQRAASPAATAAPAVPTVPAACSPAAAITVAGRHRRRCRPPRRRPPRRPWFAWTPAARPATGFARTAAGKPSGRCASSGPTAAIAAPVSFSTRPPARQCSLRHRRQRRCLRAWA